MKTKIILIIIALLSNSLALISIVSPIPDYTYFSGENVEVLGSIGFENCSGTAVLLVDGVKKEEASFKKGIFYKLEKLFENASLELNEGEHYVTITTDCGEKETIYFKVKNKLSIVFSTNGDKFMTGDVLEVSAYAFRKEKISNITEIIINNQSFIGHSSIKLEKPGKTSVLIRAKDELGNSAEKTLDIEVFNELKIDVSVGKEELKPNETASITVLCFDVLGNMRNCNASAYWFSKWAPIDSLIIPENASPGNYTIKIITSNGSNTGETTVKIKVLRIPVIKDIIIKDEWFEVISTDQNGNSFMTKVNVSFFDNQGRLVKEENILTNNKYKINLPPGTYSIVVNTAGKSFEKQASLKTRESTATGNISGLVVAKKRATLIAGLVIIALTIMAVLLQKRDKIKR